MMNLSTAKLALDVVRGVLAGNQVQGLRRAGKKKIAPECGTGQALRLPAFPLRKLTMSVYVVLLSHARGKDQTTTVTPVTIARELGLGHAHKWTEDARVPAKKTPGLRTVYRELGRLRRYGLIDITVHERWYKGQGRRGTKSVYRILPVEGARWVPDPEPQSRLQRANAAESGEAAELAIDAREECLAGSRGTASQAVPLCEQGSIERTPTGPSEGAAPAAAGHAPPCGGLETETRQSPTPSPAPRAGNTTPAPRPAVESRAIPPAPPARGEREPTRQKEHSPGHVERLERVCAYFQRVLCPELLAVSRRTISRRLRELEQAARARGFPEDRAEAEMLFAVDGAKLEADALEGGLAAVRNPVRFAFAQVERVQKLARDARADAHRRAERSVREITGQELAPPGSAKSWSSARVGSGWPREVISAADTATFDVAAAAAAWRGGRPQ